MTILDIRKKINNYIIDNGIIKNHIAKKTGIELPKLSLTLSCKRGLPAEEYFMICDALGVPYDTFVEHHRKNKSA